MNEHHSFYNMKKVKSQWLFPPIHDFGVEFAQRSEEHTSELQSRLHLVCRLLLEKKNNNTRVLLTHPYHLARVSTSRYTHILCRTRTGKLQISVKTNESDHHAPVDVAVGTSPLH